MLPLGEITALKKQGHLARLFHKEEFNEAIAPSADR